MHCLVTVSHNMIEMANYNCIFPQMMPYIGDSLTEAHSVLKQARASVTNQVGQLFISMLLISAVHWVLPKCLLRQSTSEFEYDDLMKERTIIGTQDQNLIKPLIKPLKNVLLI